MTRCSAHRRGSFGAFLAAATALTGSLGGCYPTYEFDLPESATGTAAGGACAAFALPAASALIDPFEGDALGPSWTRWGQDCAAQVTAGELVVALPSSVHAYCGIKTIGASHLACDSVTIEVPEVTSDAGGAQTVFYIDRDDDSESIYLIVEQGFLLNRASTNEPAFSIDESYDPAIDRWWRFRETGGVLFFETSPDGSQWKEHGHGPDPMPLDAVRIRFGAGNDAPIADPGQARFDCYNVPAPCP